MSGERYEIKYEELDGLLRRYSARKEHKKRAAEEHLRQGHDQTVRMQRTIDQLCEQLHHEREYSMTLEKRIQEKEWELRNLSVSENERIHQIDLELALRQHEIELKDRDYDSQRVMFKRREQQLEEESNKLHQAKGVLETAMTSSTHSLKSRDLLSKLQIEECQWRLQHMYDEIGTRSLLVMGMAQLLCRTATEDAADHVEREEDLTLREDLILLKEREITARLRRDQESLRDEAERLTTKKDEFTVECHQILRSVRQLALACTSYDGGVDDAVQLELFECTEQLLQRLMQSVEA